MGTQPSKVFGCAFLKNRQTYQGNLGEGYISVFLFHKPVTGVNPRVGLGHVTPSAAALITCSISPTSNPGNLGGHKTPQLHPKVQLSWVSKALAEWVVGRTRQNFIPLNLKKHHRPDLT